MASVPDALALPGASGVHQGTGGQGPSAERRHPQLSRPQHRRPPASSGRTREGSLVILEVWAPQPQPAGAPGDPLEMQIVRPHSPSGVRLGGQGPGSVSLRSPGDSGAGSTTA